MTVSLRKRAASLPASGRDGAERLGSRTGQTLAKQFLVPRHDDRCCERVRRNNHEAAFEG
jgi:hypothetical protein